MTSIPPSTDASLELLVSEITDEFMERLDAGERPDVEEYARRHPALARVLRRVLPALEALHLSAPGHGPAPAAEVAPAVATGCLGDYRLLREVGRGGMGVVYEAEQLSLGRRVALKVLPFAAALDDRQLQRFRNEAQAAAGLQHQHIVPVYAVGCERGVHYYAMQFVEGWALADLIEELRQAAGLAPGGHATPLPRAGKPDPNRTDVYSPPATAAQMPTRPAAALTTERATHNPDFFRTVARLGVQAAEALEHAHQLGVVHRDVKPANLLLDQRGNLWVTDFGLALVQTGTRLTRTGDLVGTLRYMSPEQALGGTVSLDHRTDIYSLGVTLYELLTLEPAFDGQDRQEILRQVTSLEPLPPRQHNRLIPVELETVLLKAIAKDPAERYATAQELADDLGRFLEDRPVQARRPTLVQRARKWARRHRGVVGVAVGLLALAALGAAASTVLIWREKDRAEQAYRAEAQQRRQAEGNVRLALESLDTIYLRLAERHFPRNPLRGHEDRELLGQALRFYEAFARQNSSYPEVRREAGTAYRRVADIRAMLGQQQAARRAYSRSLELLEAQAADFPDDPANRVELAWSLHNLAGLHWEGVKLGLAETAYRRAVGLRQQLARELPEVPDRRRELALSRMCLAMVLQKTGRLREAEAAFRLALADGTELVRGHHDVAIFRRELARTYNRLAQLLQETGRLREAERSRRRALDLWEGLVAESPRQPEAREGLAACLSAWGALLKEQNQFREAAQAQQRVVGLVEKLAGEYSNVPAFEKLLARAHCNLGAILLGRGRLREAEKEYRHALERQRKLAADHPEVPDYRRELAYTLHNLAGLLLNAKRTPEAKEFVSAAVALRQKLADDFPAVPAHRQELAASYYTQALWFRDSGRPREEEKLYRRALVLQRKLVADHPNVPGYRCDLARTLSSLSFMLLRAKRTAEAKEPISAVLTLRRKLATDFLSVPAYRSDLARSYFRQAVLMRFSGRLQDEEKAYRQAWQLQRELAADYPDVADYRRELGYTLHNLAGLLLNAKRRAEAEEVVTAALDVRKKLAADFPAVPAYQQELAVSHHNRAIWLRDSARPQEAAEEFCLALALLDRLVADFPTVPAYRRNRDATGRALENLLKANG